ncbi:Protein WVD2-like 2-like [Zea mays]|uniref:Protein WVD2-like 3 n=1 Tax=Zea mays TaxID=4577 RepID=C0P7E6_MAIZE|nr:Protein WVD2-like 2-like [Zea mays]ACN28912.1 unknown [Zea mays]ONM51883.1 Protein WVD2-like 3 [Zea mays]
MGKIDMSTDEESDCVAICPPNRNAGHEEVVSGSHDEDSSGKQENPYAVNSHMDSNGQEDVSVNLDLLKLIHQQESSVSNSPTKPAVARQQGSGHTVLEPCAVAPERRSSGAGNIARIPHPTSSGEKLSDKSSSSPRSMAKKSPSFTPRKPLQSDNTSHSQDDDSYSVTSSTVTSARAGKTKKTTVAVAPTFVCANRAEKRGEFYTKLEEKRKALEEEKLQAEARKREEEEEALRQLRKNLVVRAKPMPSFYQEGPPPKVELKKVPPTRAKSPKLTRRKSCSETPHTPEGGNGSAVCCRLHRHSIGNARDVSSKAQCSPKSASKAGSATRSRVTKSREDLKASVKKVGLPSAANFAVQT